MERMLRLAEFLMIIIEDIEVAWMKVTWMAFLDLSNLFL